MILFKFTYNYNLFNLGVHCKAFRNPVAYNAVEASPPIANHKLQEEEKHPAHNSLINPIHYSILHLVWKEQHSFHRHLPPQCKDHSAHTITIGKHWQKVPNPRSYTCFVEHAPLTLWIVFLRFSQQVPSPVCTQVPSQGSGPVASQASLPPHYSH